MMQYRVNTARLAVRKDEPAGRQAKRVLLLPRGLDREELYSDPQV